MSYVTSGVVGGDGGVQNTKTWRNMYFDDETAKMTTTKTAELALFLWILDLAREVQSPRK